VFDLPLEYALIVFEDAKPTGKIVPELLDLAQRGIVRFVDIVFIQKDENGEVRTTELNDLEPEAYEMFVPMGEHVSSLFTNDDLEIAAGKLPNGSGAALFLWENLWVANLGKAIMDAGGHLVERKQIAPEVVQQFVEALAAENAEQEAAS
jgi:Family of unknown function (DUF6325)